MNEGQGFELLINNITNLGDIMKKLELAEEIAAIEKSDVDTLMENNTTKELKAYLDELLSTGEPELIDVITKNGKVNFLYSDESTELVPFKKNMRSIVSTIIRNANQEIQIASKPTVDKGAVQRLLNLTYTRICRIVLQLDEVENEVARDLFAKATVKGLLSHQAVDAIAIKNIADSYCEYEKIGRL